MKAFALLLLAAVLGLSAGCDTFSDATQSVRQHWEARNAGKTKVYKADKRAVYEAARASAEKLGFRFLRGGPAQGRFEAISGLDRTTMQGSRQIRMSVSIGDNDQGTTLTVKLSEIIEDNSFNRDSGTATETPLRDTPYYEVFFRQVATALGKPANS